MPVPGGEITSTDLWQAPTVEEAIEIIKEEDGELLERLTDADAEEATEEYKEDE